ncbi:major capsid protein P2 [Duganella sp. BuS-21]|uniref:major capsid protein P2 n=1 Tax=Duganella sp. BuS-21 TaxID=2943848 RepID=UPI0035A5CF00
MGARLKAYPFNNVQATGLATCDLNGLLGFTIERLVLVLGGTFTKSMITGIQLKANGKIIWDTTGPRTDSRMQYRGITANAGFLTLDFSEIRAKTENGQSLGAIDTTVGIANLKLEVQITGATAPTLVAYAEVSPPQIDPINAPTRNLIARIHTSQQTIGASGQVAVTVPHLMPSEGGSIFKRVAIFSANMTGLLIKKNGITIEESTKALNDFQQNEYKKVPQAGLYMYDAIVDDNQSQALNTRNAQTMEFLGTFSAGETITVEVETLEPVDAF